MEERKRERKAKRREEKREARGKNKGVERRKRGKESRKPIHTHQHLLQLLHSLVGHTDAVDFPDLVSNMQRS